MDRKFPESPMLVDASMEIAGVYLSDEQFKDALPFLKKVIVSENASLKPKALLRLGIAYYNLDNNKDALTTYSDLLSNYPNAQEAEDALENAKTIFVEEGRSAEYISFARNMGKEVSPSQEEQLAYGEAEVQFNNGNFPVAALKYENYLQKFPEGKHVLEALYYKSEIYFNQKDWSKAVAGYEQLADKAPHKFGEKSILTSARLNFFEIKDYSKAEKYFSRLKEFSSNQENRLEAMRGLLRSQFQLQEWSAAKINASELLVEKSIGTDDKVLANLVIAKSELLAGNYGEAISSFKNVASMSKAAFGAEARYEIAHCLFLQGKLSDAEKAAFETTNKSGSYEEWVLKSYLLLGDIYYRQKDYFNAKATFQSIIENASIEALRKEAEVKLEEVKEAEKKTQKIIG
jgi:TolA-binding protein